MSFREKTAWISMVSMGGIYGVYFWSVKTGRHAELGLGGLLATVIALVVVQVVLITAVAIFAPRDAKATRDEREKLIELKADRIAYSALATGIACAVLFGAFTPPLVFNANALLFILVAVEVLRAACRVIQYRVGG